MKSRDAWREDRFERFITLRKMRRYEAENY